MIELPLKIGRSDNRVQMGEEVLLEDRIRRVKGRNANFKIKTGPLLFPGTKVKDWLVFEIHYQESLKSHKKYLLTNDPDSQLGYEYAEEAHRLASEYLDENNLAMVRHLNSFPEYRAIVSKLNQ